MFSPSFVFPVLKQTALNDSEKSSQDLAPQFYVLYGQWEGTNLVLTYLDDFRNNPVSAMAYLHLTPHLEYKISKGIVLVQAQFLPYLSKQEARQVLKDCLEFYSIDERYSHVEKFNLDSENFSFYDAFPTLQV